MEEIFQLTLDEMGLFDKERELRESLQYTTSSLGLVMNNARSQMARRSLAILWKLKELLEIQEGNPTVERAREINDTRRIYNILKSTTIIITPVLHCITAVEGHAEI
jgi:hypothetical protein